VGTARGQIKARSGKAEGHTLVYTGAGATHRRDPVGSKQGKQQRKKNGARGTTMGKRWTLSQRYRQKQRKTHR